MTSTKWHLISGQQIDVHRLESSIVEGRFVKVWKEVFLQTLQLVWGNAVKVNIEGINWSAPFVEIMQYDIEIIGQTQFGKLLWAG